MKLPLAAVVGVFFSGCACLQSNCRDVPKNDNPLRVGVFVGSGARANGVCHWESLVTLSPDVTPTFVDEKTIAAGALTGLDVLVMPGGSSYAEFDALRSTGADVRVKDFIRAGGGYVGTCAGNCLVLNEANRLCLSPYERLKSSNLHGTGLLTVKFNDRAKSLCGIRPKSRKLRYSDGPVMRTGKPVEGASFETIASYDCDLVCAYGTNAVVETMRGCPAAICGTYGKGRVFAIAVHPEYRADTLDILEGAFRYVSGRTVRFERPQRKAGDLCVAVFAPGIGGVADAEMIARLVTAEGIDVTFMNHKEEIGVGMLDHADVLLLPGGFAGAYGKKFNERTAELFNRFVRQGGRAFAYGAALRHAPEGTVACDSALDMLDRALRERP